MNSIDAQVIGGLLGLVFGFVTVIGSYWLSDETDKPLILFLVPLGLCSMVAIFFILLGVVS